MVKPQLFLCCDPGSIPGRGTTMPQAEENSLPVGMHHVRASVSVRFCYFFFPVSALCFPKVPGGLCGNFRFFVPGKSCGILAAGHRVETFLKEAFATWDAEI